MGLSQGYSAILIPKLFESDFADRSQASWIASLGVVPNPLGAFVAGICAECFGRRFAIALATLPHAAGWLLIALSRDVPMLYVGRFVSGIGTGMANGLYLYVSEVLANVCYTERRGECECILIGCIPTFYFSRALLPLLFFL